MANFLQKLMDDLMRLTMEEQQFVTSLIYGELKWKKTIHRLIGKRKRRF